MLYKGRFTSRIWFPGSMLVPSNVISSGIEISLALPKRSFRPRPPASSPSISQAMPSATFPSIWSVGSFAIENAIEVPPLKYTLLPRNGRPVLILSSGFKRLRRLESMKNGKISLGLLSSLVALTYWRVHTEGSATMKRRCRPYLLGAKLNR